MKEFKTRLPRFGDRELATYSNNPLNGFYPSYGGHSKIASSDRLLVEKAGDNWRKYDLYLDLLTDGHCFAMWDKQISEIISRPIVVTPVSENHKDIEVADFCQSIMDDMGFSDEQSHKGYTIANGDLSINQLERSMHSAQILGVSFAEVIWKLSKNGQIVPEQVKFRDPRRFEFYSDINGKVFPRLITKRHSQKGILLPARKFIIFQNWSLPSEAPEGYGIGRLLYFPVVWKREALTYYLKIIDKHHDPSRLGTYPTNSPQEEIEEFFNIVEKISNNSAAVMPAGFDIKFVEHSAQGAAELLRDLMDYCDRQISLVITGETTSGESVSGNTASERINNSIRLMKAKSWNESFLKVVEQSLLKWCVDINYPGSKVPHLSREWMPEDSVDVLIERVIKLGQAGFKIDPEWMEEKVGMPFLTAKKLKPIPKFQ